ncbi:MAG TPA: hypothetical protein VE198_07035, partial [Actinoallomurus sp.]|nr:hypothetical protein [Actinoallomurus sp.]
MIEDEDVRAWPSCLPNRCGSSSRPCFPTAVAYDRIVGLLPGEVTVTVDGCITKASGWRPAGRAGSGGPPQAGHETMHPTSSPWSAPARHSSTAASVNDPTIKPHLKQPEEIDQQVNRARGSRRLTSETIHPLPRSPSSMSVPLGRLPNMAYPTTYPAAAADQHATDLTGQPCPRLTGPDEIARRLAELDEHYIRAQFVELDE